MTDKVDTRVLHIVNGDCTLHLLQQSGLPGAKFSGDDILMEGPTRNCLREHSDWQLRAVYLQDNFNIPSDSYLQRISEREQRLLEYSGYDEVVLWFEEDLFFAQCLLWLLLCWRAFLLRRWSCIGLAILCWQQMHRIYNPLTSSSDGLNVIFTLESWAWISMAAVAILTPTIALRWRRMQPGV